jgi:[pyruvate, water dikinase]-phosphate phosphotransferase / [pyruvate, water dikinase] kinase
MRLPMYLNVHLVSDSTGETLNASLRAVTAQFDEMQPLVHSYYLVRSRRQLEKALSEIEALPGIVLFTIAAPELREMLETDCRRLGFPHMALMDPVINMVSHHLNLRAADRTGGKYALDEAYFQRMEALTFTMMHDDGQLVGEFDKADIVLVGVSRTSKTPTSIYLANRGFRTANYPLVPTAPVPPEIMQLKHPLVVGLKVSPDRLLAIRRNRLLSLNAEPESDYVDEDLVRQELTLANRLFERQGWPVIDVTRRSIEETAAQIMNLQAEFARKG